VATAGLALVVGASFAIMLLAQRSERDASAHVDESARVLTASQELERLVIDLETGQRGFVLTRDEVFLQPWRDAQAALPDAIRKLEDAARVPVQDARAHEIGDAIQAYVAQYSVPLVDAARRGDPSAGTVAMTGAGKERVDALRVRFDQLLSEERSLAQARQRRAEDATRWAIGGAIGGLAGSVVIVFAYGVYLTKSIVGPLRRASTMAGRLAAGDLGGRMAETGAGEIGTLQRSFNTMATSLEESRNELAASRARVVAAADAARQRIERDLHDGVQQRLVSLGLELRATDAAVPSDMNEIKAQLSRTSQGLIGVVEELQEVSRGIHPAILSKGGLAPALKSIARRSGLPVELHVQTDRRLPEAVEAAAYYVVSEGLTNAAKHAQASVVDVDVRADDRSLHLSIRDDGVGGADPRLGSGLIGLRDRVEAVRGSMDVTSSADGTTLLVTMPIEPDG
jgi:signal transduction histidine kinase